MTTAASFDMECVQHSSVENRQGVLDTHRLVQAIGVKCYLEVELIRDSKRGVDRAQGGAGVLVHLESADMRTHRLTDRCTVRGRAAPQ